MNQFMLHAPIKVIALLLQFATWLHEFFGFLTREGSKIHQRELQQRFHHINAVSLNRILSPTLLIGGFHILLYDHEFECFFIESFLQMFFEGNWL